jgi:hypothetical protein
MTAAFYDKPKLVHTREINGGHNIRCRCGRDRVCAWHRHPTIDPTDCLCASGLIADVVWVFHSLKFGLALGTRSVRAIGEQRLHLDQATANLMV